MVHIALIVDIGGLAHIVDLGRGNEGFTLGQFQRGAAKVRCRSCPCGRKRAQQLAGFRFYQREALRLSGAVHNRAGAGDDA